MCYCKRIRLILILTLGLVLSGSATAQVTVDPIGFSAYLEGEAEQVNLILTNNGNDAIAYTIDYDLIKDEEDRNAGPRRDELGDAINDFQFNAELWTGLAWDGNLMWGVDYSTGNMIGVDLEGEIREEARINSGYTGLCWDGDGFWASSIDNNTLTQIDNEFDVVQSIRINQNMIFGVAWDGENLWYSSMSENDESTVVFQINLDGEVLHSIDCRNINSWICAVAWVPDHGDAPLWILGSDTGVLYQVNPEEDRMDDVQSVNLNQGNLYGLEHDGENLWYSSAENRWYVIDDGIIEFNMLTAEPETGVINGNDEEAIQITLDPTECEAGLYNILVTIELTEPENDRDDFEPTTLFISVVASVENDVASISGTVTDASNDGVVSNTTISMDRYIMTRFTDEEGYYSFNDLPPGEYQLDFSAVDFLPTTETVEITDEDIDLNVSLLHSECTPSERQFTMQLEPGYTHEFEFQVDNGGNGPLTYAVDRRLLGDANAEPFELRQTDEIQDACGDDMLAGAVFAEEQFFISGGNNGGNPNKIYILNADREVVGGFDQFVEDRYGMRDLAYDGELIWGAVEGTFYGFTTTGDLEIEFSVDANLEGRALAWDPVDEVLLASDISTDIFAINRDGDVVETYNRPDELRIYGLGVWPDDPDDCYLYVFCRGPDNVGINVFKLNPVNSEYMLVAYFDVGDGRPSGIQITNQLDVYSWVIVSLVQNPDRLNVWQLDARKEWFQVTPTAGVIEPDEHEGFVLTLDATGLPTDNDFCGEVVFMHDGIGQETALDVTLSVVEGRVQTTRDIDLHIGWNTISTNLQPNDNENIEGLVDSIVTTGAMIMMKNTNGDFYRPAYDFNNIQAWNS